MTRKVSYRCFIRIMFISIHIISAGIAYGVENFFGSVSSYPTYISSSGQYESLIANNLRGRYFNSLTEAVAVEAAYELSLLLWLHNPDAGSPAAKSDYRIDDLPELVSTNKDADGKQRLNLYQNLDRLNFNYRFANVDLSIGRQALAFGIAKGVSPNDVLQPFSPVAIDKEDRRGVDAVRGKAFISNLSEIDFGAIFGEKYRKEASAFFIRPQFNLFETDVTISALKFLKNQVWGLELQAPLSKASGWFDGTITWQENGERFNRLSFGVDYSFGGELYAALEYHYNGAGADRRQDYLVHALNQKAYLEEYVFLLAKNYLIPILGYAFTPLVSANGSFFINLDDASILNNLRVEYNIRENSYLALGGSWGISSGKLGNEFKRYPKTSYGSWRYYF